MAGLIEEVVDLLAARAAPGTRSGPAGHRVDRGGAIVDGGLDLAGGDDLAETDDHVLDTGYGSRRRGSRDFDNRYR
jgi:hypothetical protein